MTVALIFHLNPNPNPNLPSMKLSMALSHPPSPSCFRFGDLLRPQSHRFSLLARRVSSKGLGTRILSLDHWRPKNRSTVTFAASSEDSKHSEIEVEKGKSELEVGAEESQEAWKQTLESFKEQAIKMQSVSHEAYELYSKKAMIILKETSEQLKIQAEKASYDLNVVVKEISEEGAQYLSTAADKSPEEVKDIVEVFVSASDDLKEVSQVRDFYLGIPYGVLLSLGGFLSFMLTGSTSAIRFGVILGSTLLFLSISSLRSWKQGEASTLALKGQAVIAGIIFLREMRLLSQRPSFPSCFMTFISGAMVAFYLYRIILGGDQKQGSSLKSRREN